GQLLSAHGFAVETIESFNKVALLPWWAYSKLFHAGSISKLVLKIFDKSVWFWRRLDLVMPWPGLSLVVVGRKAAAAAAPVKGRSVAFQAATPASWPTFCKECRYENRHGSLKGYATGTVRIGYLPTRAAGSSAGLNRTSTARPPQSAPPLRNRVRGRTPAPAHSSSWAGTIPAKPSLLAPVRLPRGAPIARSPGSARSPGNSSGSYRSRRPRHRPWRWLRRPGRYRRTCP